MRFTLLLASLGLPPVPLLGSPERFFPTEVGDRLIVLPALVLDRHLPLWHARVDITLNTDRHLYDSERRDAAVSLVDLLAIAPRSVN